MTDPAQITVFQAIVLGIIQGFSEFLPISSSAHLFLAPMLFGWPSPGLAFDAALHVGTLIAVLWYFRREWVELTVAGVRVVRQRGVRTPVERRVLFLILATIPAGVAGLLLQEQAEHVFRDPRITAVALILLGVILWAVDKVASRERSLDSMGWTDALAIGIAQILALVPGVSRSGATITAGRALGFDRKSAAVFAFMMSMPIIAAAAVLQVPRAVAEPGSVVPLLAGIAAAAASGWLAIAGLIQIVARYGYGMFAVYRILLGILVLWVLYGRG
jgi:undecaprenyl-diphosphatase